MNNEINIAILGAGTWGIALARMLALHECSVSVWSALESEIDVLTEKRAHPNLPSVKIPESITFTKNISQVCANKDIVVFAVPSVYIRSTARLICPYIHSNQIIVSVAKGIESNTLFTMTEVLEDEITKSVSIVALSGPTHAEEVAQDIPTAMVSAGKDIEAIEYVRRVFSNHNMRIYTNTDVKGVEICGATKNIIALAAGISSGLGFGDNTKAALLTRGMAEITRLGLTVGCVEQTFSGLAGIGDLIVTATSEHSRNNRCGRLIGHGMTPQEAVEKIGMVVEGINALYAVTELSKKYRVNMPIISAVNEIINGGADPRQIVSQLMERDFKSELSKNSAEIVFENTMINNLRRTGMKRVITYGTFDLLHYGHINLLKRAKALGDYLIVVVSSDEFNWNEKHKKCYFTYDQRKALVEAVRYVDLVIPETCWEQKKSDVHEYHVDTFVMGDDWTGKFDYLRDEGVEVVYLSRTPEISTTQIKQDLNHV